MKNPIEVLRAKEQELSKVKREIDALQIAARLLGDEPPGEKRDLRQLIEMP